jgi:hypothetical protein
VFRSQSSVFKQKTLIKMNNALHLQVLKVFAEEWVSAVTPFIDFPGTVNTERIEFLRTVDDFRGRFNQISFLRIMQAIGDRIKEANGPLRRPLCNLFMFFMEGYARPQEFSGFNLNKHVFGTLRSG